MYVCKDVLKVMIPTVRILTTQVLVESVSRPPVNEADEHKQRLKRKRLTEEAAHASSVAARELRAVVTLAGRRGLNAEEIFRHFVADGNADARAGEADAGCRRAGTKDVITGMEGLGISLSEDAAALLIETIVRSSGEPSGKHSTRLAADADQLCGNLNRPLRVPKGRYAAKPRRARETSLRRPAAGQKTLPPLLRQHITAEDLWIFASRRSVRGGKVQSSSEDAKMPIDRGQQRPARAIDESLPGLSREEANEVATNHSIQSIHGEAEPSSMRKRARNIGITRGSGSAKEAARKGKLHEEAPSGMGSTGSLGPSPAPTTSGCGSGSITANIAHQTNRGYNPQSGNPQACLSTMPSFSAAGDAAAAPTTADASPTPVQPGLTAEKDAPRPRSMPSQVGSSIDSHRKRDLEKTNGSVVGPRRRRTVSACGGSVAGVPSAAPSTSHKKAEVASFPCNSPTLEATDGKDRVFHVDRCDW